MMSTDTEIQWAMEAEHAYQQETLCLVASRSILHPYPASGVLSAFTNVTTEGYPGHRYHAGSRNSDTIEDIAKSKACALFGAQHANVQSHSASTANLAVLTALSAPGDTILSMDLKSGGHLTHGNSPSMTGRYFHAVHYGLGSDGRIDLDEVEQLARQYRPAVIVCGSSSYPQEIDFAGFRRIADQSGSVLLADISHNAGLVIAGLYPSPVPHAHITTLCTHKQLFGPKGGLILSGPDAHLPVPGRAQSLAKLIDRAVFPHFQGSPDMGAIAGKACTFDWASTATFRAIMSGIKHLAALLSARLALEFDLVSGGTSSHMVLVDLRRHGLTGKDAETVLEAAGILTNRNRVPGETVPASVTSGLRMGTNVAAYRGMQDADFQECCDMIAALIIRAAERGDAPGDDRMITGVRQRIATIMKGYPLSGPGSIPGASR
jgi:glycine hydroxymethyltransferase